MKCPKNCSSNLVIAERHGVEIDYCPECRGVWLDRGELDKIIERAEALVVPPAAVSVGEPYRPSIPRDDYRRRDDDDDDDDRYRHSDDYRKRKKKSFLGDLFDF